ncbi:nuclear distribution protein nude [Sodiomyces alkalinus F11]|uniref:Nuclear distribution protein nude n=1 Tax=Sodiomyces alkalinus (strain CBS 110278 / VKM F-3762 / F11) TaxID=1314773 RepID=A0A3N2PUV5_SODAK|nr:nuclear distribution protein nude [Sodiomyces alkalinus F11]ROT38254.1 nuclear distribution protein nude [Sodiomyces alkalinus F11]
MTEPPSSPPGDMANAEDALSWYKSQYEVLEQELAEFRESSKELEQELEKDIEQVEKRERAYQQKAESLSFEVEEWKTKYKQSKAEANAAQNALEKEITNLREANRALTLKLRDIEVANDDIERQARHTTSSLEDLESKYNVAIERGVMMEEEIKIADKEREALRIESQRLREELSDLKIEADLLQDKLKKQEARHLSAVSTDLSALGSPTFDEKTVASSPTSVASSPLITTPPDAAPLCSKSPHDLRSPPSPPMSDASAHAATHAPAPMPTPMPATRKSISSKTPAPLTRKSRLPSADHSITPKPRSLTASSSGKPPGRTVAATRTPAPRTAARTNTNTHRIPASNSLTHIRSLTAQMQRLEARVQSARSKLPAPIHTPPRYSPRSSVNGAHQVPSTVTIRSRKRTVGSTAPSSVAGDETTPTNHRSSIQGTATTNPSRHVSRPSISGVSRLSFGPLPNRNPCNADSDPPSISRPSSRASISSYARPASRTEMVPPPRPASRTSLSGRRTPLGRPRSSIGMHGYSNSITHADIDEAYEDALANGLRTPSRRGTYSRYEAEASVSGIPQPTSAIPVPGRRQSGGSVVTRRTSNGVDLRASSRRSNVGSDLLEEETY